jgi:hypothetical protein
MSTGPAERDGAGEGCGEGEGCSEGDRVVDEGADGVRCGAEVGDAVALPTPSFERIVLRRDMAIS